MKPQPVISVRVTSEKRAAAARANGAKSRGPVTALGKANSSRNRFRHGLRAGTLPVDPASAAELTALLASYIRELQPQSQMEHRLVETLALTQWRQACLRKLETAEVNREIRRLKSLLAEEKLSDESPVNLAALAFRSLSGEGCSLDLINRLECRCDRQYDRALDRLQALQPRREQSAEKINTSERTPQILENTPPLFAMVASARS